MATDITGTADTSEADSIGEINKYNFRTETTGVFKAKKGLNEEVVHQISDIKKEPDWMRKFRLDALKTFEERPMPKWGGDIAIDFQDIFYYLRPTNEQGKTWDDVPEEIKETFEKLGIPEAERKFLSGVKAQFESEVIYGSLEEGFGQAGSPLHRYRHRSSRTPRIASRVLWQDHSSRRQQVRSTQQCRVVGWFLHLRPQGRSH